MNYTIIIIIYRIIILYYYYYDFIKTKCYSFIYCKYNCAVCRQMLFCRVTLGKSFLQFSAMKMAHAPPGHHSVIGRPSVNGLAYAEYVIYRGEQVRGLRYLTTENTNALH